MFGSTFLLIEDYIKQLRDTQQLPPNEFRENIFILLYTALKEYDLLCFTVPTSPISDSDLHRGAKPAKYKMILKCTANKSGAETILIRYGDEVSEVHNKQFTLTIDK